MYFPYLDDNKVKEVIRDNSKLPKFLLWEYFPFARYAEFNDVYDVGKMLKGGFNCSDSNSELERKNGFCSPEDNEFNTRKVRKYIINDKDVKYLLRIISLSKESNVKLLAYNAPEYSNFNKNDKKRQYVFSYLNDLLQSNGITLIDFSTYALCDDKSLFLDPTHLSKKGIKVLMDTIINGRIKQLLTP